MKTIILTLALLIAAAPAAANPSPYLDEFRSQGITETQIQAACAAVAAILADSIRKKGFSETAALNYDALRSRHLERAGADAVLESNFALHLLTAEKAGEINYREYVDVALECAAL